MAACHYLREGRITTKDGNVEFDVKTIDGIGLPPFPPVMLPGGFPRRINEIINLDTRSDDVLLATYPKCGTHWTYEILNMLAQGKSSFSKEFKRSSMIEAIPDMNMLERLRAPRIINTHLPYKWFPRKHIENGGKIIHTTRNPKDAYVSSFHHFATSLELGPKTKGMTWSQYFKVCVIGKDCFFGTWFDYEKEMEQAKQNNGNIHTVHFEKLKQAPEQEIKGISNFLDLDVSDDFIREIAQKCQFQNLKKASDEVKEFPQEIKTMFEEQNKIFPELKYPIIFRKDPTTEGATTGKRIVGDWKNYFTVAQNEQFDALCEKELTGTDIKVIY